jgi:copper chaperone CopZ
MNETKTTLSTHGIKCQGCASAARSAVEQIPGVQRVDVDLPGKTMTVTHGPEADRITLARALSRAGFPSE